MREIMIRLGNLLFKWRNIAFPLLIVALYLLVPPPADALGHPEWLAGKDVLALAVVAGGLALRGLVIGYRYIKRGGLDRKVYADRLVTGGMFGVGRNPLYVGNLLIYAGLFLLHGDPRVVAAGCALFLFIYQCIVLAEERYLAAKFGPEYAAYCRTVPRWGLRLSRFAGATAGMAFDLRKAVLTDYSTILSTTLMAVGTLLWRQLAHGERDLPNLMPTLAMAGMAGLCALAIRAYKKSPRRHP